MPTKKSSKKTPKKRAPKKKSTKKKKEEQVVHKHIEEAAARIPDMIAEEVVQTPPPQRTRLAQQYHHDHTRQRRMMWAGVLIIAAVICGMWLLNVSSLIGTVYDNRAESDLFKNTRSDFSALLNTLTPEEEAPLQEALNEKSEDETDAIKETIVDTITVLIDESIITTSTTVDPFVSSTEDVSDETDHPPGDDPKGQTEE